MHSAQHSMLMWHFIKKPLSLSLFLSFSPFIAAFSRQLFPLITLNLFKSLQSRLIIDLRGTQQLCAQQRIRKSEDFREDSVSLSLSPALVHQVAITGAALQNK